MLLTTDLKRAISNLELLNSLPLPGRFFLLHRDGFLCKRKTASGPYVKEKKRSGNARLVVKCIKQRFSLCWNFIYRVARQQACDSNGSRNYFELHRYGTK